MNAYTLNSHLESLISYYTPKQEQLQKLQSLFYLFADETRLKIMFGLTISKMCVGDISATLGINRTTVSHQLAILKNGGMVKCVKDGKLKVYFISNQLIGEILRIATKTL